MESVVTMAENFGVQGRGRFYDQTGTLRDVVQNHLLQLLANLTMELPAGIDRIGAMKGQGAQRKLPRFLPTMWSADNSSYRKEPGVATPRKSKPSALRCGSTPGWRGFRSTCVPAHYRTCKYWSGLRQPPPVYSLRPRQQNMCVSASARYGNRHGRNGERTRRSHAGSQTELLASTTRAKAEMEARPLLGDAPQGGHAVCPKARGTGLGIFDPLLADTRRLRIPARHVGTQGSGRKGTV